MLILIALFVFGRRLNAAESAAELARYLPAQTNAVTVVRVAQILQTDRAQREGWAETAEQDFLTGASRIPTWVDTLVIGSLVRPAMQQEVWSTAILELPPGVTMERLARREETHVEQLAGMRAVEARRDALLVEIRRGLLGIRSPAMRQETARWAQAAADGTAGPLAPGLQEAAANPAHIVLSLDLRQMVGPDRIREYLEQSDLLPQDPVQRLNLLKLLPTQQSLSLYVTIDQATTARVVIRFDGDATGLAEPVAAVFRQLVDDQHLSLDEFASAKAATDGRSVTLTMSLSDASLRRVVSLISSPSPGPRVAGEDRVASEPPPPSGIRPRVAIEPEASKRYCRAVSQSIDDLARVNLKAKDYNRTATWHDNFARRIDQLPTAGVDPVLLAFGTRVSERFRALAASLRGQGVEVNVEQQTLVYNVDYRPNWATNSWWGVVGYGASSLAVTSNLQEVREHQAAAVLKGTKQRTDIWKMITDDRREIESQMRATYGDAFFQHRR